MRIYYKNSFSKPKCFCQALGFTKKMINLIVVCVCVCSNVMYGDGMIRQTKPQYVTNVNILQLLSSKKPTF
jgi:hypothetical protein